MADNVKDKENKNIHKGHRQKVKERFYESGMTGMPDHNILEMLLFFGIPQKDTNPIAHELIEKFGSFSGVLEAKRADLLTVKGMTESAACLITMLLPVNKRYLQDLNKKRPVLKSTSDFVKYLRPLYLDTTDERIYVLCLDSNDKLINCRQISDGDFTSAPFDTRKLVSAILDVNAKKVLLSHNHPSGKKEPSTADIEVTKTVESLSRILKFNFVDHIIITDSDYFSFLRSARHAHLIYGTAPLF